MYEKSPAHIAADFPAAKISSYIGGWLVLNRKDGPEVAMSAGNLQFFDHPKGLGFNFQTYLTDMMDLTEIFDPYGVPCLMISS